MLRNRMVDGVMIKFINECPDFKNTKEDIQYWVAFEKNESVM